MIERVRSKRRRPRAEANHKKLTESNARTLAPRSKQHLVWDDPAGKDAAYGLAVLVSPRGVKSYRCVYYFPGSPKPHWKNIGRVGEVKLEAAREATRKVRKMARAGEDPRADDAAKSDSFGAVVEDYVRLHQIGERGNKSAEATGKLILSSCPEEWRGRPIATIRFGEVEKVLQAIRDGDDKKKPRPYLANRLYAHLADLFRWCGPPRNLIKRSPMEGMPKPRSKLPGRKRDWFRGEAADQAIKLIWSAATEIGGDEERYLKLLLLTGKRPGIGVGLAGMRWEEIDDRWFWDAPPSGVRNKRLHAVPISTTAQRQLHPRRREGPVFNLKLGRNGDVDNKDLIKRVCTLTGIADFIPHGIRHLVETKMAGLIDENERAIVPPYLRDMLLDHAPQRGAGAGYDHHDYKPEMRAAMEAWGAYVEGLVSPGEGVVRLR